jgi:hypothetical protein
MITLHALTEAIRKRDWKFWDVGDVTFIPKSSHPFPIYVYSSGSHAAIFKVGINNDHFALRVFFNPSREEERRSTLISQRLSQLDNKYLVKSAFYNNGSSFGSNQVAFSLMSWVGGARLDSFISEMIATVPKDQLIIVLRKIQNQIKGISEFLESNLIGHGDIQCGNIMVVGDCYNLQLKLIDYDAMFVPEFAGHNSSEPGVLDFQHPSRVKSDFSSTMDRFSFWVMLTALEALIWDSSLWKSTVHGGFNNDSNLLFTRKDFQNPQASRLFHVLLNSGNAELIAMARKLISFSLGSFNLVPAVSESGTIFNIPEPIPPVNRSELTEPGIILVKSNPQGAPVFSSLLSKLGNTPLKLSHMEHMGKTLIINSGGVNKRIEVTSNVQVYEVNF